MQNDGVDVTLFDNSSGRSVLGKNSGVAVSRGLFAGLALIKRVMSR